MYMSYTVRGESIDTNITVMPTEKNYLRTCICHILSVVKAYGLTVMPSEKKAHYEIHNNIIKVNASS